MIGTIWGVDSKDWYFLVLFEEQDQQGYTVLDFEKAYNFKPSLCMNQPIPHWSNWKKL